MFAVTDRLYNGIARRFGANPMAWILAGLLGYSVYNNNETTDQLSQICSQMISLKEIGYGLRPEQIQELQEQDEQFARILANRVEKSVAQKQEDDRTLANQNTAETFFHSLMRRHSIWGQSPLRNVYSICSTQAGFDELAVPDELDGLTEAYSPE